MGHNKAGANRKKRLRRNKKHLLQLAEIERRKQPVEGGRLRPGTPEFNCFKVGKSLFSTSSED